MSDQASSPDLLREQEKQNVISLYRKMEHAVTTVLEQVTRNTSFSDSSTIIQQAKEMKETLTPTMNYIKTLFGEMVDVTNPDGKITMGSYSNHDIQHPMRNARQFFLILDAVLDEKTDDEKKKEVWHRVEEMAYDLEKVLYIFQDLASRRLAMDSVPKDFIDMDKGKSIGGVLTTVEKLIIENGLKVEKYIIDIPPEVRKLKVACAHGVLFNKISNMLHNVMGRIEHDIQSKNIWFKSRVSGDYLEISISDDGIGIQPEKMDTIFEEGHTTKSGKGLGLAFAKKQLQSMGGDILVNSTRVNDQADKDKGGEYAGNGNIHTTFTIKIPLYKEAV